jgi:hypothetical protein
MPCGHGPVPMFRFAHPTNRGGGGGGPGAERRSGLGFSFVCGYIGRNGFTLLLLVVASSSRGADCRPPNELPRERGAPGDIRVPVG